MGFEAQGSSGSRDRLQTNIIAISPGEGGVSPPLTITCGVAQIQKHVDFDPLVCPNTLLSLTVLLAIESVSRPMLTYSVLLKELLNITRTHKET